MAINAEKMLTLEEDAQLRALIAAAEIKYPDGISIVRSLRKIPAANGEPHRRCRSVGSADGTGGPQRYSGVLIGGREQVLQETCDKLRRQWNVNIVGSQNGYFAPAEREALFARIAASGAQIVTVAQGSPRRAADARLPRTLAARAIWGRRHL